MYLKVLASKVLNKQEQLGLLLLILLQKVTALKMQNQLEMAWVNLGRLPGGVSLEFGSREEGNCGKRWTGR